MNILPKKSWHVLNKDNLERVRKDEEKARKEEEDVEYRAQLAEKQRRISLLRDRARQKYGDTDSTDAGKGPALSVQGHVNLFEEEERQRMEAKRNEEYEAEKRKEREKFDRQITMYLEREKQPWYASDKAPDDPDNEETQKKRKRDDLRKNRQDPLSSIQRSLKTTESSERQSTTFKKSRSQGSGKKSIEQMRQERLEREMNERKRAQKLMGHADTPSASDIRKKPQYTNQFNPAIAKQNQ